MRNRLSIRSYTAHSTSHMHHYHQLVLPLSGYIDIVVDDVVLKSGLGDCVVIRAGSRHDFSAPEAFRFLVADLNELPANLTQSEVVSFLLDPSALAYIQFVDKQLSAQVDKHIEAMTLELFLALLARQSFARKIDPRIQKAVQAMRDNLARSLTINELANIACLSTTQYKNLFKAHLGMTTFQYLTQLRMERARALLTHSDYPIGLIAEQVGFQDPSAFSRSFSRYFGQPPKFYAK
ncbi:helix-turn-helix domain-containing protein [Vibrio fluvialis]|uniref:AraC family transcriptional regulator n=1 Tax=Vibrio fluvialis TaxID=676 RepID=UPI001C9C1BD7|nr:helix-turn-helix domain-containing protein [Vibrio fluvialis]MBY7765658.1 helix-turn-helix domain-containing protein [Vibrio fluvialis]MBY7774285.1 helix-turn-helix domain-containing protein [Vibrio fluvialis]MBY7778477.1 helix-turn-helix domain-containing protein [Vibrio fluvialis]MBY7987895.1 helix-turn-helix domain-containing protein [Vibrio fluvialis]MBY7992241.1 helix-turn-helix domain-containing protein [Vibrio fluvialis]